MVCAGSDEPRVHVRRSVLAVRRPRLHGDRVLAVRLGAQVPRAGLFSASAHRHASTSPAVSRHVPTHRRGRSQNDHRLRRRP